MNTDTETGTPLTLTEYLAMPESDRYDVDYRQAPALYNEWAEKHGVTLDIRHVQKPDADMITYRAEIKRASDPTRAFWFDYSTGVGWVQHRDGTPAPQNITYNPRGDNFVYTRNLGNGKIARGDASQYYETFGGGKGCVLSTRKNFVIKAPTAPDILYCLKSDASVRDCRDFEDFADEFGYDKDSRKAEETYRACRENTRGVENAVGRAAFAELLLLPGL